MSVDQIARVFEEIGHLLEFQGENPFKIRAYLNAAQTLRDLDEQLEDVIRADQLLEIPGIGRALADKIVQLSTTGSIPLYDDLRAVIPIGVLDLLRVPGLGPKRVRAVYDALGVASLEALEEAARDGRLAAVPGFGERSVTTILQNLDRLREYAGRFLGWETRGLADRLLRGLMEQAPVTAGAVAGSLRRRLETVHDVDLVLASDRPDAVFDVAVGSPEITEVISRGDTKLTVLTTTGVPVDVRVVPGQSIPFALLHFTGSAAHNTRLREIAKRRKLKLNEYGLFPAGTDVSLSCSDEATIYAELGLAYIPPELREGRGEIEAAKSGGLPDLIEPQDIRGVVHCHTQWTDGRNTIAEMAAAARDKGYEYLVICDHSQSAGYVGGLGPDDLDRQRAEIADVTDQGAGVDILTGSEVDILPDGTLDYSDDVLERLDCVVASVHSHFELTEEEQTARVCRALENPHVDMLGHPTGRLLLARDPYPIDLDRVLDAAAEQGVVVEINAHPRRLDLDWRWHQAAVERGVRLSINPDAHGVETIDYIAAGVEVARKGWVTSDDVVNTLSANGFLGSLR